MFSGDKAERFSSLVKGIIPLGFLLVATWQLFPGYISTIFELMAKICFGIVAFLLVGFIMEKGR